MDSNYDLQSIIANSNNICQPGIEFRNPTTLEPILKNHELWNHTKRVLQQGAELHFTHRPTDEQNHRKAQQLPDIIRTSIDNNVKAGYTLPIHIETINNIPNAMVCLLGIASQHTVAEES